MKNNDAHRYVPFRVQRSLFAFIVFGLLGAYTLSVQWSHVEQISGISPAYIPLVKVGLASVEVIICLLLIWELWARDKRLTLACFGTIILLEIVCVIHAGAILQLDTNRVDTQKETQANVDAQIRLAAEVEKARVGATADAAAKLNSMGQTRTARRLAGAVANGPVAKIEMPSVETTAKKKSFLPDWYLNGAQYFITILLAYAGFAFCFFVSRSMVESDEASGNLATGGNSMPPAVASSMTIPQPVRSPVGFTHNVAPPSEPADPKDPPRS